MLSVNVEILIGKWYQNLLTNTFFLFEMKRRIPNIFLTKKFEHLHIQNRFYQSSYYQHFDDN